MIEDTGYIHGIAQTERIIELSEDQNKALKAIDDFMHSSKKYMVIGGIAGSGKSSIIPFIVEKYPNTEITAPTGKAVMVLKRKGLVDAMTLHSFLYIYNRKKDIEGNYYFEVIEKPDFHFNGIDLVIVDEASMVNHEMFNILSNKKFKVLYIGDHFQLPPVKDDFNILSNPDFKMEKVLRQNQDNPIIYLAELARNNKMIPLGKYGDSKCKIKLNYDELTSFNEIITWTNDTRKHINDAVRRQYNYLEDRPVNDEKMICKNNHIVKNLFNGQIVYAVNNPKKNKNGTWKFELIDELAHDDPFIMAQTDYTINVDAFIGLDRIEMKQKSDEYYLQDVKFLNMKDNLKIFKHIKKPIFLDYGYALTCHNAQGSSWENVAVIDEKKMFHHKDYFRWLYTAITRAEKVLTIYRF